MNSQAEVRSHLLTNPRMAKSDSMPNTRTFVIVGGGLAGVTAPAQSPAELADAGCVVPRRARLPIAGRQHSLLDLGRIRAPDLDRVRCGPHGGATGPAPALRLDEPAHPGNDRLIFSKGHASPLLYAMFKAAGAIDDKELIAGFRRFGSRLQGHPTPALPSHPGTAMGGRRRRLARPGPALRHRHGAGGRSPTLPG